MWAPPGLLPFPFDFLDATVGIVKNSVMAENVFLVLARLSETDVDGSRDTSQELGQSLTSGVEACGVSFCGSTGVWYG
jgi:hypothetical protein